MDQTRTEDAVRWLRRSYRAGALVDALAAFGMAAPALSGPTLRFDQDCRRDRPEFAYALRAGAPLMAGWTVLLLWADRKPLERRGVLPITIARVIAGLMANDAHCRARGTAVERQRRASEGTAARVSRSLRLQLAEGAGSGARAWQAGMTRNTRCRPRGRRGAAARA
jgi:hypothetical protein